MKVPVPNKSPGPPVAAGLLLFGLVLCTFLPAVWNDFVGYDDPEYVTGNPRVQQGLNPESLGWAFGATAASNWHPVTWLSHMLDCQLYDSRPSGHHFTSILLHAFNSALLFILLRRMTAAATRSFIVSAFFGLHPLRVESVVWISERKDVLSGLFFMLTLWAYSTYASGKSKIQNSKSEANPKSEIEPQRHAFTFHLSPFTFQPLHFYALTLLLFALGLMAKPMLVTLPFILLLLDYWPLRRWPESNMRGPASPRSTLRTLLLEKVPFALLAIAASIITYLVQKKAGAVITRAPLLVRGENAILSYGRYLGKLLWPAKLAPFYPFPDQLAPSLVISVAVLLLLLTAVALRLRRESPPLIVGWLWYVGMLVPVIGLVQAGEQAMADRYSYLPSIGIFIAVVWGIYEVVNSRSVLKYTALTAAFVGGVACAAVTLKQIKVWQNSETLFTHAIRVTKNNYLAHNDLGAAFEKQGRLEEAGAEFQKAIKQKPDYAEAHDNLGVVLQKEGQTKQAMTCYSNALTFVPDFAPAHNHLGLALAADNRLEEAIRHYKQAIKRHSDYADAHFNLALVLAHQGQLDAAIQEYRRTLEIEPRSADAHNNLGTMLDRKADLRGAIEEYRSAISLKPDYARAHLNLGMALAKSGRIQDAIFEVQQALRLNPESAEARQTLDALSNIQKAPRPQ